MSYSQFELDAIRVASDLSSGNATDAAAVLRQEMYYFPQGFSTFLYEVNRLSTEPRRDDIIYDTYGNVLVRDRANGESIMVGRPGAGGLPPILPPIVLSTGAYGSGGYYGTNGNRYPYPY